MEVLTEFGIKKEQVLSMVTDNATNMLSTVQKLNSDEDEVTVEDNFENQNENEAVSDENNDDDLDSFVDAAASVAKIHHMRCAEHTLQLAIRDGLKQKESSKLLSRIRAVVVAARAPKLDAILKRRAGKGAILDQATRWGSTYLMVQRMLELKFYLNDMANPAVTMSETQWDQVKNIESLLRHPFLVTKRLHSADLTPGQFYKEWRSVIFHLGKISNILATEIKSSLMRREILLLDNEILLTGIYVDPKVRILLSDDQQNRGKTALYNLAIRLKGFLDITEKDHSYSNQPSSSSINHQENPVEEVEEKDEFEKFLDDQEKSKRLRLDTADDSIELTQLQQFRIDFFDGLEKLEKINRSTSLSVLEVISHYPEIIQEAALLVTALPPTQVSVERLFSALKIIKSDLRASI